jgi:hypothetical protein
MLSWPMTGVRRQAMQYPVAALVIDLSMVWNVVYASSRNYMTKNTCFD